MMKTNSLNELFEDLAANASRNYKIETLKNNDHNSVLRKVISLALDPFTQFYQRKIPKYTPNKGEGISLNFALDSIQDLSKRLVTGNAAIEHLKSNLEALNSEDAKVLERVIQKDLKCGVSSATVNEVWPNLVYEYPCMLCSGYSDKLVNDVVFPAYVQLKMDGMRFNAIVRDGNVEFRSRNGKEIQIADPLFMEPFKRLARFYGIDMVFDGELLVVDAAGKNLDRKTGNGILNKAVKGTQSKAEGSQVRAELWDAIPLDVFMRGKYNVPYSTRVEKLDKAIKDLQSVGAPVAFLVSMVPTYPVDDLYTVQQWFNKFLALGQEGIILKTRDGIWENKRTKSQIKFKGELECDLVITGVEQGTGKYKDMLGAIVCESSDGLIKVNVGSGFNDDQRKSYTPEDLLGKVVAVKYNARITNKAGEESLFLPIFVELREDKTVPDHSKEIK